MAARQTACNDRQVASEMAAARARYGWQEGGSAVVVGVALAFRCGPGFAKKILSDDELESIVAFVLRPLARL